MVMWNSTQVMTASVRYALGPCLQHSHSHSNSNSNSNSGQEVLKDTQAPAPSWRVSNGSYRHTQVAGGTGYIYSVLLPNLQRDSSYCYQVADTSCEYSERMQFRTSEPDRVTIAALSDAGTWGNASQIIKNIAADNSITLVLHPGDLSYGKTEDVWDTYGHIISPVAQSKPYMISPGNWDVKPEAIKAFMERYTMPLATPLPTVLPSSGPLHYFYSFNYSVLHILMLDAYDAYDAASMQYVWLEADLKAACRDRHRHPWIVVGVHSPMYSSNAGHNGGDESFRQAVEPLLLKYNVDLILTGHDHGYERSYPVANHTRVQSELSVYHNPAAPIHILVGTAGASLDPWLSQPGWSAVREASFGYTKLHADHHSLTVTYIRQDHSIGDQFTITKGKRLNLKYLVGVVMVCVFSVLPLVLYKGLPTPVRNFLLCRDDEEGPASTVPSSTVPSSTPSNIDKTANLPPATNNLNKWV